MDYNSVFESQDNEIIKYMQRALDIKYSDEQMNILKTRGGMCILASAGSGKTSTLTSLIAKRIQTHEIADPSKLLCTTFSRGGAYEMEHRLKEMFEKLGYRNLNVQVKTMHATYLKLLRDLGYDFKVIETSVKMQYIREACKEYKLMLEDEDYMTLESLLGYQINNLMSDEELFNSYVYTLRDRIPLQIYSSIRQYFNNKKSENGQLDFDDLQLFTFSLLKNPQYTEPLKAYCHSLWTDIYVDEAQDISKIQFEILKMLISDPNRLVFIGDDDQCLVEGTKVRTINGLENIEDLGVGDWVLTASGHGSTKSTQIFAVNSKEVTDDIIKVTTKTGKVIDGTKDHVVFAKLETGSDFSNNDYANDIKNDDNENCRLNFTLFGSDKVDNNVHKSEISVNSSNNNHYNGRLTTVDLDLHSDKIRSIKDECAENGVYLEITKEAKLTDTRYNYTVLGNLVIGMNIPVYENGVIIDDVITNIEKVHKTVKVYDISIPETRNFIANDVVVHNCIYQWRGADPSIILNICGLYTNLKMMKLTTNYRCRENIVNRADHGIKFNRVRSEKTMNAYNKGGEIKLCDTKDGNILYMSRYAFKYIKELIIDKGVNPSDIAVLSRNNAHLTILNNMLFKEGIFCKASDEMKFTKVGIYKNIEPLFKIVNNTITPIDVSTALWKVVPYLGVSNSRKIAGLQSALGISFADTLGLMLTEFIGYKDIEWKNPGIKLSTFDNKKYSGFAYTLRESIVDSLVVIYNLVTHETKSRAIVGLLSMYLESAGALFYKTEEAKRFADGFVEYIESVISELGMDGYERFMLSTEQFESGKMAIISPMVTMSTIHGAKGKEWKYVIIFADDNVSFPSMSKINSNIIGNVPASDIRGMIDEDRRLHYVAMTRAKENLTIFANKRNLSIYALEALGVIDEEKDTDSDIIAMAQHGIYDKIVNESVELFDNPLYKMSIDIADLNTQAQNNYANLRKDE
ncbi:MAG: UvrD-helicase domain-containing protein [Lachnospiraceae bacterium]|nr:UvrD-helicase domain-containing protein [Lachnospiraceae bacterium]